ncbi:DUF6119 family protein [Streptomyces sp. NPDC048641]|uniref:DUF6119 family protein n=1 Tax=Streptomyces sp. NPDC048641 TaxID=3154825 RepID=UPI003445FFC1
MTINAERGGDVPRQSAPAKKATVYRLTLDEGSATLKGYVQDKYLDNENFKTEDVTIGEASCLLASGKITTAEPRWAPHVKSLTDRALKLENVTAAVALLIPYGNYIYTLTWGFGHLPLEPTLIDPGFGLRFAIRKASPEQVRSLTSHTMDTLARTARTSVPTGAALDAFGVEEVGEVISRLVGRIPVTGLTASAGKAESYATVRGADGLSLPLSKEPGGLIQDLIFLDETVEKAPPVKGLEHFEHTRPLRPGAPEIDHLQKLLSEALEPGTALVALSWPAEWQEEHGEADSYRLRGAGTGREEQPEELGLRHLLEPLAARDIHSRLDTLKRITIQGLNSDDFPISRAIHGDKWITFQTDHDGQRYVFHQGRWFNIGGAYLDLLKKKVEKILGMRSSLQVPSWPQARNSKGNITHASEGSYNLLAQKEKPDFLCLDKKLLYTTQHPKGFEVCDLLGPENELIHVKRMGDSVSASHLFNQAIVSAEALRRQADALSKFQMVVDRESQGKRSIPDTFRPGKVVLAFGGRKATPEALFTFSQVTLARCAQRLAELEVDLEILELHDSSQLLKDDLTLE